jgi:hypothetical protein
MLFEELSGFWCHGTETRRGHQISTGPALRKTHWYHSGVPDTVGFMHRKGSAVNHIALDKEDEAIKRFVLSLPVGANGAVLELGGRAVACLVPVVEETLAENSAWSEAKNARRCALIDKEIDGTLSAAEAVELHLLQREMLAHRRKVAPLPLAEARKLREELLANAQRRPSE